MNDQQLAALEQRQKEREARRLLYKLENTTSLLAFFTDDELPPTDGWKLADMKKHPEYRKVWVRTIIDSSQASAVLKGLEADKSGIVVTSTFEKVNAQTHIAVMVPYPREWWACKVIDPNHKCLGPRPGYWNKAFASPTDDTQTRWIVYNGSYGIRSLSTEEAKECLKSTYRLYGKEWERINKNYEWELGS